MPATHSKFIDAHHHLWDLNACHYPWLMARGETRFFGDPAPIQKDYLVADFLGESSRFAPHKSVHIQVGVAETDTLRETRWLQSLGEFPHGIVAYADLVSPTLGFDIQRHKDSGKFRGIRQIIGRHAEEDKKHGSDALLDNPHWVNGLALLAREHLSFDLQLIPGQMERAFAALAKTPELKVALCHAGSPWDQSPAGLEHWREGLRRFAQLPNFYCKVSGLGMFNPQWEREDLKPLILDVLDIFGPERVMFGSNFPVDKLYCSYDQLWSAYFDITSHFSSAELQQMFYNTAESFYCLD
jgi:predicted TIM-barrel fold metal-dependent hydrolase